MENENGKVLANKESVINPTTKSIRYKEITIAGLDAPLRIRSLNDREWTEINSASVKKDGTLDKVMAASTAARLIVRCVVDMDGNRVFTDSDVKELRDVDASIIDELATACRDHVGIKGEAETKND